MGVPYTVCDLLGVRLLVSNERSIWLKPAFGLLLFVVLCTDAFASRPKVSQVSRSLANVVGNESNECNACKQLGSSFHGLWRPLVAAFKADVGRSKDRGCEGGGLGCLGKLEGLPGLRSLDVQP